jgi:CxxC-x17-CxxC domain-containing protein
LKKRNPRKVFNKDCNKCWIIMQTTYAPNRKESVYCKDCFNKEIY